MRAFNILILSIISFGGITNCIAQEKAIEYTFEQQVIDSLRLGIKKFERMYHKPAEELKLVILISTDHDNVQFVLQAFAALKDENPFIKFARKSNRYVKLLERLSVPIVFPSDSYSIDFREAQILAWPYTGYFVLTERNGIELQVIRCGMTL